jgi:predicted O-methyltransferase YrrM
MWNASDVIKILAHQDDLVCGAYPMKCTPSRFPIGRIFKTRPDGLMEVSYAPTGFMRIRRKVFEKLYPGQAKHGREKPTAVFFERKFNGATRDGGDVAFCRKWIATGGKVVVDPHFTFSHIGEYRWTGSFAGYLADEEAVQRHLDDPGADLTEDAPRTHVSRSLGQWADAIRGGDESEEAWRGLAEAYGNKPWAATPELAMIAYRAAKALPEGATILECGSGLTTIALGLAGRDVLTMEESPEYAERTQAALKECGLIGDIRISPMNCRWYEMKLDGLAADMIVIDGPRRGEGVDRLWPLTDGNGVVKPDAVVIADDLAEMFLPGQWETYPAEREFVIGRLDKDG